ncbi:WD40-repeat-containing domain protein [Blastocladiella britannica]|nr:WD40-repeat-containing domain protein [Blastocladiella britannica]
MITALRWLPRGAMSQSPRRAELDHAEVERIKEIAGLEIAEGTEAAAEAAAASSNGGGGDDADDEDGNWSDNDDDNDDDEDDEDEDAMDVDGAAGGDELAEYNMDDYDGEPDSAIETVNLFSNIKDLTYTPGTATADPYLTLAADDDDDSDASDDDEAMAIAAYDSVLVVASTADEISQLEFQVLEGEPSDHSDDDDDHVVDAHNLYTHHDVMLPTFPLALEYLDYAPGSATPFASAAHTETGGKGAFLAVAGFHPDIEIWDADVIDAMVPVAVLGAPRERDPVTGKLGKKKKITGAKARGPIDDWHTDAVLALSWNPTHRNMLASASADTSVKIWDLDHLKAVRSFVPHTPLVNINAAVPAGAGKKKPLKKKTPTVSSTPAKVCLVSWSPAAPTCLLTGGHDATVRFFDTRAADSAVAMSLTADPESCAWNPAAESQVYVSTEDGHVVLLDLRNTTAPVWTLAAHSGGACSSVSVTPLGSSFATVGADKTVKVWGVDGASSGGVGKPGLRHSRQLTLGPLFSCAWCPDREGVLAVGGAKGSAVIDLNTNAVVRANAWKAKEAGDSGSEDEDDEEDDE